jgi:hypothetical protein
MSFYRLQGVSASAFSKSRAASSRSPQQAHTWMLQSYSYRIAIPVATMGDGCDFTMLGSVRNIIMLNNITPWCSEEFIIHFSLYNFRPC